MCCGGVGEIQTTTINGEKILASPIANSKYQCLESDDGSDSSISGFLSRTSQGEGFEAIESNLEGQDDNIIQSDRFSHLCDHIPCENI